jgi:hypothetical protein
MFKEFIELEKAVAKLDGGTQFKIFDRATGRANDIDSENHSLEKLIELIKDEAEQALLENNREANAKK